MRAGRVLLAALALAAPAVPAVADAPPTVAAMRHHHRVLILTAPATTDPKLVQQMRALAGWRRGARDRDLVAVELIGSRVTGAADRARLLRRQWRLPPGEFQAVLVGKDGREAVRSLHPLPAATLRQTIDAMPMRRAGGR